MVEISSSALHQPKNGLIKALLLNTCLAAATASGAWDQNAKDADLNRMPDIA